MQVVKYQCKSSDMWNAALFLLILLAAYLARQAVEKQSHEKELAACLAREAEAKQTHEKELAASLAREAEAKQTHEKELAACLAREAEAKETHEKELAASLAREAKANDTHERELAVRGEQKAETDNAHQKEVADKTEKISTIVSMYQGLHDSYERLSARLLDEDLVRKFKSENARLKNTVRLQGQTISDARHREAFLETELSSAKRLAADQETELFNAFQASQHSDAMLEKASKTISRQSKIISKTTNDLTDISSELEKTYLQNWSFRQAMEQDPGKTADMDNALDLLKSELGDTEERAIQAEEDYIQLEKRKNLECLGKDAEITALSTENGMLRAALDGELASKRSMHTTLESCLVQIQSGKDVENLKTALEMYCSAVGQDDHLHATIGQMRQMHSQEVQKNKALQSRYIKLEAIAQDADVKISDLESALRIKSDKVDILEIEADAKKRDYETSLTQRDQAAATAKDEADQWLNTLKVLRDAGPDACISWWFKYQEIKVDKVLAALQTSENLVKDLQSKLTATERQCSQLYAQDYSEDRQLLADARDQIRDLRRQVEQFQQKGGSIQHIQNLADAQDKINDLQKKLEESDCKYASRNYVKWSDHISRVNEVREQTKSQTESQMRQAVEAQVFQDVKARMGDEYVVPLRELGGHLWARIGRLEQHLSAYGPYVYDTEREGLLKASMWMAVDTSGGVPAQQGPWN